jgi:WD40 repeat protein
LELKGHKDVVEYVAWAPHHVDLLATASGDKTVRVWDARQVRSATPCDFTPFSVFVFFFFFFFVVFPIILLNLHHVYIFATAGGDKTVRYSHRSSGQHATPVNRYSQVNMQHQSIVTRIYLCYRLAFATKH